ncbi:ABC transporter ATP-binding protein (plasmid) [Haloferacaceae archaeon DSL9]
MTVLDIQNLHTYFHTSEGTVRAVEGVDIQIEPGEIVGLVGESGSGKSVTARSAMRLVDSPGAIVDGTIEFNGRDVLSMSDDDLRRTRGDEVSMVFQDPMAAFNPTQTVGRQLHDVLRTHRDGPVGPIRRILGLDRSDEHRAKVVEMLDRVGIPEAETRYDEYPHEFSGGMLQRAMIAMSLLCNPDLILADEPTTALDVTIEGQILALFRELVDEFETAVLWITHDLSIVSEICDTVVVMYAGKVMETGPTGAVLDDPKHPYTQGLLRSVPRYDRPERELHAISGSVPSPHNRPDGCRFVNRCPEAHDQCYTAHPPTYRANEQTAACYLLEDERRVEVTK